MSTETIELAKSLIEKPSISPNDAGCIPMVESILAQHGFQCTPLPFNDVTNLWATHGEHGPTLALLGHTDVVPTGDEKEWLHPPFSPTIVDDALYGRGACDMKGALAAMIVAAKQFVIDYPNHPGRLAFILTSDEEAKAEHGTKAVVQWLETNMQTIDYALVGEPSSSQQLGDVIKIGRRGSLNAKLTIKGKQGHVAYPEAANNPIHASIQKLGILLDKVWDKGHPDFPNTSLQISNIHSGNGATNVIPGNLYVDFNFRYNPSVTAEELKKQVEALLHKQNLNFDIEWHHSGSPFITIRESILVDAAMEAVNLHTKSIPELSTNGGTSDGRFMAKLGTEIIELGPLNETIHQINEWVSVQSLIDLTAIYYDIIKSILLKDKS